MATCIRRILANRLVRSLGQGIEEKHIYENCQLSQRLDSNQPTFCLKQSQLFNSQLLNSIPTDDVIEKVEIDQNDNGIIFVNKDKFFKSILDSVVKHGPFYNRADLDIKKKKVLIEFSSPNIAKPFHVGHLKSTVLGNSLSNLYKTFDHDVVRMNYLGDYGIQFVIMYLAYQRYGSEEKLKADPLNHLYELYVNIHKEIDEERGSARDGRSTPTYEEAKKLYKRIDSGERIEEYETIWKKLSEISRLEYDKMYKRLGIEFDETESESMYFERAYKLAKDLEEQGKLNTRDGMGILVVQHDDEEQRIPLRKSDLSTLYITRDIVAIADRFEKYRFDQIHYVVSADQSKHFSNLYSAVKCLYPNIFQNIQGSEFHVKFGRIIGISTRKGDAIFLEDVLNEARDETRNLIESSRNTKINEDEFVQVADHLAISSAIAQYLSSRGRYEYDKSKFMNLNSDSGLFLQYCHARLYSLKKNIDVGDIESIDHKLLPEESARSLIYCLARYPDILQNSLASLAPHLLVHYLFQLGHSVNTAYADLKVKDQSTELVEARLGLFNCARQTLAHGLKILGIEPLNEI